MHDRHRVAARAAGTLAALTLALTSLNSATAQTPATPSPKEVLFLSAAQLAKDEARTLGMAATYSYQTIIRDKNGEIEIHDDRNDIIVVQEGRAEVQLGGTVVGNRVTAPGEHRGGTATGYRSQTLAPGDLLYIPAGMPHLINLENGTKRFRYLVVKTQP